ELGTDAAKAANAVRADARSQLASAIIMAGGPKKLVEFVLRGPQEEVGTAIPRAALRRAERRAIKQHALEPRADGLEPISNSGVVELKAAPRFMQWARGHGGKQTLQCAVYLRDGSTARHKESGNHSRLSPSLNTSDPDVAAQRMRLILWRA